MVVGTMNLYNCPVAKYIPFVLINHGVALLGLSVILFCWRAEPGLNAVHLAQYLLILVFWMTQAMATYLLLRTPQDLNFSDARSALYCDIYVFSIAQTLWTFIDFLIGGAIVIILLVCLTTLTFLLYLKCLFLLGVTGN